MKRSAWILGFWIALVAFVPLILTSNVGAQQKTISLNYSNLLPGNHKISLVSEEWCKEIEKRTNGGVKITMFHGGTLTPATQAYDGVVKGLSDVAMSVFSYHRGRFPLTEFSDLPIGVKSCVTAAKYSLRKFVSRSAYSNSVSPAEVRRTDFLPRSKSFSPYSCSN